MNERIKQLAETALEYAEKNQSAYIPRHWFRLYNEKFAELIVRECVERVAGSVVRDKGHIPQDPHSQGWNDAVAYAGKELKKHFGVE
jgi:hypothetical protein